MQKIPKVVSVTSGKGGVGKTNISVNMGLKIREKGYDVLVLDADLGLANVNVLFNISLKKNIYDMLTSNSTIDDIIIKGPGGIDILPASSGVFSATSLEDDQHFKLISHLETLNNRYDYIIIDTSAGIGKEVLFFNSIAHFIVVVVTSEPTSITDAYATIKVLNKESKIKNFKIVVNMVNSSDEGKLIYNSLYKVASRFLNVSLEYLGHVLQDKNISKSVLSQTPLVIYAPKSSASVCIDNLSKRLIDRSRNVPQTGNVQLFWEKMVKNADF